jgi:predicted kinase
LPGSGKTTHAKRVERELGSIRFSADEWMDAVGVNLWNEAVRARIESLQWELTKQILKIGGPVVIEWGTWGKSERDLLRTEAQQLGAAVELHFLDVPLDVLFDRVRKRKMETPAITRQDLEQWDKQFQRPSAEELELFDPPSITIP